MSECEKCHGTGEITCSACNGQKTETCKRCGGSGKVLCNRCSGNGEITCQECGGSGTVTKWKECSVCDHGKVRKTRWINCDRCHGTGTKTIKDYRGYYEKTCYYCSGRGQVEEKYTEICPNCNGEYRKPVEKQCSECYGRGYIPCETKCGEHRKVLKCRDCDGTGRTECSHCGGTGTEKCPDCERREKERKAREAEQKKKEEQRRAEEERKKGEAKKRKEQEEYRLRCEKEAKAAKQKERRELVAGCGCWIVIIAIAGFLVWWWLEGFTTVALSRMWEQTKNVMGGGAPAAIGVIGGVSLGLFLLWKLIRAKKNDAAPKSTKKRWVFIILGLLLGPFGVHLLYAKRWFLFLLLWAAFITGGVMSGGKGEVPSASSEAAQVVQQADDSKKDAGSPVGGIGFAIWGLLWIGGTLFIKKDGKGNRM